MLVMARKKVAKPLDQYRRELYMEVTEFIGHLGVATHTYYAALKGNVRLATMRRIAEKLEVEVSQIAEFEFKPDAAKE